MKRFLALALLFGLFAMFAGCDQGGGGDAGKKETPPAGGGEAK